MQYVAHDDAINLFEGPFETAMRKYPGMVRRTQGFWTRQLRVFSAPGNHLTSHHAAYYGDSGVEGFLTYQIKEDWPDSNPDSTFELRDLIAVNDDAYAALWDFCISQDLIKKITCQRAADEPLRWMLKDRRAISARSSEELYLRLVDVRSALSATEYDAEDAIVIEVVDDFCPWNAGKYMLDASDGGAFCSTTGQRADVTLDARELASLYLGGVSAYALHRSRLIDDHSGDATARLGRLFNSPVHPWPHLFW
jgi:predicted acetyltransferase